VEGHTAGSLAGAASRGLGRPLCHVWIVSGRHSRVLPMYRSGCGI
jgi:hypothetical protein